MNKVLGWKFDVFPVEELLRQIIKEGYAGETIINKMNYYTLTPLGDELIKNGHEQALEFFLKKYPAWEEFITAVFSWSLR